MKPGRANAKPGVHSIEGESLTAAQIGSRLGISTVLARERLRRERKKPGPVTWDGLRGNRWV